MPARLIAQNAEDILPLTNDPNDPIGIDHESATLGGAASSGKPQASAHRDTATFGPEPPTFSARAGEVLTAVPSLHERSHHVRIELSSGLARVDCELEFENTADKPAELLYRLAVPGDAALLALEVCGTRGCRSGVLQTDAARLNAYDDAVQARGPKNLVALLPVADARKVHDARGTALQLRAAPVSRAEPLHLKISYLANAAQHAARVRFTLPARGMDPRAAALELNVSGRSLVELNADGLPIGTTALHADAWSSLELSGQATKSSSEVWRAACGANTCLRAYVAARAIAKPAALDIVLAIDASPSMEGSARSRLLSSIAAIVSRAPAGSRIRALRFASQAVPLFSERKEARELALDVFAPVAFEAELGAATRFEAAWRLIESWGLSKGSLRTLIVIVGDGGLTTGSAKPFDAARRAGVEVAVVNVADRPTTPALVQGAHITGGAVIDVGPEADAVLRRATPDRLEERVAALFQPSLGRVKLPNGLRADLEWLELRGGDSVLVEGRTSATSILIGTRTLNAVAAPHDLTSGVASHASPDNALWLAVDRADLVRSKSNRPDGQEQPSVHGVDCDRRGPALRQSGLSSDAAPVALAQERALCVAPTESTKPKPQQNHDADDAVGAGMPSSPLLSMLRQRILPVARGCFRRDRAGRADYQVRAVFEFELADREVLSAKVVGKIADTLRDCLLSSIDSLAVPRFSGRVVVRYPLVTERELLPSQIELTPQTATNLDSLIGGPRDSP